MTKSLDSWISVPEVLVFVALVVLIVIVGIAGHRKSREVDELQQKVAELQQKLTELQAEQEQRGVLVRKPVE